jgi:hypothetical protein
LGLPWLQTIGSSGTYLPGYVVPGFCTTSIGYDGYATSECSPMTVGVGMVIPGTAGSITTGASHPARFGIAWALVATAIGVRRRQQRLLLAGAIGLGVSMAISAGLGFSTSGVCAAWLAVGLLAFAGLGRRIQLR